MPIENRENPYQRAHQGVREIASSAGFMGTPEWHRARACFLRWLDDPDTRLLAQ